MKTAKLLEQRKKDAQEEEEKHVTDINSKAEEDQVWKAIPRGH